MLLTILLTGCGPTVVYEYGAPASAEGRICTSQCGNHRNFCLQTNQNSYQQCLINYNQMMYSYNSCKKAGGKHCYYPPACIAQNNWQCDESYRACFTSCGGTVTPRIVKNN